MSDKHELDVQWDADVINFWQASLQSYKTCHDADKPNDSDAETIASNLIDALPKKTVQPNASLSTVHNDESSLRSSKPKEQKDSDGIAVKIPPKRASHIQEEVDEQETTNRPVDHSNVVDSGAAQLPKKRKATVELPDTDLPPTRRNVKIDIVEEEEEEQYDEEQYEEEQYEEEQYAEEGEEEEQMEQETHSYENTNKKAKYHGNQQEYYYHQNPHYTAAAAAAAAAPPAPPPMPPSMPAQDNEAFSNLIMSWYYAGYYTGLYQARQR